MSDQLKAEDITFTAQEFYAEVCKFRSELGSKLFWAKSEEKRQLACKAITFVYFRAQPENEAEQDLMGSVLLGALEDYEKRAEILNELD
jgi:hypothetical protein